MRDQFFQMLSLKKNFKQVNISLKKEKRATNST